MPNEPLVIVAGSAAEGRAPLAPGEPAWADAPEVAVALEPTPIEGQVSAYVRKAWASRRWGLTRQVGVRALVTADTLLLRLGWSVDQPHAGVPDNDIYADACGVLFPLDGRDAELRTMGDAKHPVRAWYWRAGARTPFALVARGLGTAQRDAETPLAATAERNGAGWSVVFAHPLGGAAAAAPLARGVELPVGFAVWAGAAEERAGLKAHTPTWHRLQID